VKILFTHRYYWPDTAPYAVMLRTIARHFADAGHEVSIFSSRVSYRDVSNAGSQGEDENVSVKRCWVFNEKNRNPVLRMLNVLIYCFRLFANVIRVRPDVVSASTFPPVLAAWFASLAARIVGAKFIYHMMDIHPEVSEISGGVLGRAPCANIMRWLDNQTLRRSNAIVVLSQDMADTLVARGVADLPIHIINNFMLENDQEEQPPAEWIKDPERTRIIFAGNMGRFQNLDNLADGVAMVLDKEPNLEMMFLGDGQLKSALEKKWGHHPQFKFAPFVPFAQAKALIKDADLGVVSLSPEVYKVAYPSKVLSYLGLGVPILGLVEPESQLAIELEENALGVVAQKSTAVATADAVKKFLDAPLASDGVMSWYKQNASADCALLQWQSVLGSTHD
jgi:glycosyltransferase involved in cell wall biosynthesis